MIKMKATKQYYVYIMSNKSKTLYTGVTDDLERRVYQHKNKLIDGFTKKYKITILVYYEETTDIRSAIAREKQIKGWRRSKKIALIESMNPQWNDLSQGLEILRFAQNDKVVAQNDMVAGQNDKVVAQDDIVAGQNDIVAGQNDMVAGQNDMVAGQNDMGY